MGELKTVCKQFFPDKPEFSFQVLPGGHINRTYKITFAKGNSYVLQTVNKAIFRDPFALMNNIQIVASHLKNNKYPLKILQPIPSKNGLLEKDSNGDYWRAFPFFEDTTVFEKSANPKQAFEAAKAFGLFLKYLDGININSIKETIPNFHNIDYRLRLFDQVVNEDPFKRNDKTKREINTVRNWQSHLKFDFKKMPLRVVHNDTKISNILLDKDGIKGVCVIDLDTVMPGYLVTDFGDMIRTMCCTASEEEVAINKVDVDLEIFSAVAEGFLLATKSILTKEEKENLINGGVYIIFEQAIRFLTDYLQGDIYYPVQHIDQNLFRTRNQLKLLKSLLDKKKDLELIISELC